MAAAAIIIYLAIIILMIASWWKIFSKAGQPGWAILIPIYNLVVMLKVAGKPVWWIALILLIPFVNIIMLLLVFIGISQNFGKGAGLGVGMWLLPIICVPILAFSKDAVYNPKTVA
jgi:hypothetical protein